MCRVTPSLLPLLSLFNGTSLPVYRHPSPSFIGRKSRVVIMLCLINVPFYPASMIGVFVGIPKFICWKMYGIPKCLPENMLAVPKNIQDYASLVGKVGNLATDGISIATIPKTHLRILGMVIGSLQRLDMLQSYFERLFINLDDIGLMRCNIDYCLALVGCQAL